MTTPQAVAALDIGTNSVVLLLLERQADGTLRRRLEPARVTRLGEDTARTGKLKPEAIERTLAAVAELMRTLHTAAPDCAGVAVATSAVRDAANGAEFLARCTEILGAPPRLLSGDEEADTMFLGAASDQPPGAHCLCTDIGGGSTELAAGTPGLCGFRTSLDLGCVRLAEAHHLFSRAAPADIAAARKTTVALLRKVCRGDAILASPRTPLERGTAPVLFNTKSCGARRRITRCQDERATIACDLRNSAVKEKRACGTLRGIQGGRGRPPLTVLACGGTATTFAAMATGVVPFDPERIHGMRFNGACIDGWAERLLPLSPEERAAHNPGLSPDRAPVLPAGLLILGEILRAFGAPEVSVTTRGLRHGLCLRLLAGELMPTWRW